MSENNVYRQVSSGKHIGLIVVVIVVLAVVIGGFFTVDTGEKGVVLRFGRLAAVDGEGLHLKIPLVDDVKKISVRDRNLSVNSEVSSSDIQTITVEVSLVYALDPNKIDHIFQTYGMDIENTLIRPTLSEKINAIIAEYPIETFVEKRAEISSRINTAFSKQAEGTGVIVKSLLITNHDFSDDFNKAIEAKKVAEQGALTAKFTLKSILI